MANGKKERLPKKRAQKSQAGGSSRKKTINRKLTGKNSAASRARVPRESKGFPIVAVGASAGGLEAVTQLLTNLPIHTGMAFIVIEHLAANHSSLAVEILSRATQMPVREAKDGIAVEPDNVYVIPPDRYMSLDQGKLRLFPRPALKGPPLPIDFFLKSLAAERGRQALGVILSGNASDGSQGICAIKNEGGITFAQDPKTAQYEGMPRSAIATEKVDFVLSPKEISTELSRLSAHPYLFLQAEPKHEAPNPMKNTEALSSIFGTLRRATRVDFSQYKATTLKRRIQRRIALLKVKDKAGYAAYLKKHPEEIGALFDEMLINVTQFFRDPDSFEEFKKKVLPEIFSHRPKGQAVRIWIPGCASGEEAYSAAICVTEFLEEENLDFPVQIFASDLSERALARARSGSYPDTIAQEVSQKRLQRFFRRTPDGRYQVQKFLRDICLFSKHDLASDPPFAKLDLIICRNVLIYFEAALQKKIIPLFHYSLNQNGILWLGRSENIGNYQSNFSELDKIHRFFRRKAPALPARLRFQISGYSPEKLAVPAAGPSLNYKTAADAQKDADRAVLAKYGPPGVTVNADSEIIQFRGRTATFFEPIPGQANLSLPKMLRADLLSDVKTLLDRAKAKNRSTRREGISFNHGGETHEVNIEVTPLNPDSPAQDRYYVILFEQVWHGTKRKGAMRKKEARPRSEKSLVVQLQRELESAKDYLQSITDKYETTQEELTTSNEELQSTNEELQSTNEELETAKEELQSTNEELNTVNEELQNRNTELTNVNNDLLNLVASVDIPILIVGIDYRIRRFTPKASKVMSLIPTDVGRPIGDIKPNIDVSDLEDRISRVIETMQSHESEVKSRDGKWNRLQIRPYRTTENKIDGVVISLFDIDAMKRTLEEVRIAENRYRSLLESAHDAIVIIGEEDRIEFANQPVEKLFGYKASELIGKPVEVLLPELLRKTHLQHRTNYLKNPLPQKMGEGLDLFGLRKNGTEFPIDVTLSTVHLENRLLVTAVVRDITEEKRRDKERAELIERETEARRLAEEANRSKDDFLATLSHELRTPLTTILSWTQLLLKGIVDEKRARVALETIELNAKAQGQLIDDLLDVSRIMAGKLTLEERNIEPANVVRAAAEMIMPLAEKKRQQLNVHAGPLGGTVRVDPMRLQQILWNLLTNAVKFTPEDGKIVIALDQNGDKARIRVTDSGKGIPPEFLPKMFRRFSQADTSITRDFGGLGLGLALVRRLAEVQGGSVTAESPGEGKGAIFTVEFPLRKGAMPDPCPSSRSPRAFGEDVKSDSPSLKGIRILLVEDERGTAEAISTALSFWGAIVETASSAAEAVRRLEVNRPDIFVSDIAMPGEDGYSLLRKVRAFASKDELPAIALSAFASDSDRKKAQIEGFSAYLTKPVDLEFLATVIVKAVREKAQK